MPTPYGGVLDGHPAVTAPHLLVSGPTGVGKTRRVLAPGLLAWPYGCVAVSSKDDLMGLTWAARLRRGAVYLLDLTGSVTPPEGVRRVVTDPTTGLTDEDAALDLASLILRVGHVGAGEGTTSDAGFWQAQSAGPLAALLLAGAQQNVDPETGEIKASGGMPWVVSAAGRPLGDSAEDHRPSWVQAIARTDGSIHAEALEALLGMDDRLRDSVTATIKAALSPWLRSTVRTRPGDIAFSPSLLEEGAATLYVVAPANGVAAGAAVAVVDAIVQHWRSHHAKLHALQITIDELANTCPLPDLPSYVTEARGLGVSIVAAVQATSQLRLRWGEAGAAVLRDVFPAALIQAGAPEKALLDAAAWWGGETERWSTAYQEGEGGTRKTRSAERMQAISAADLLPRSVDEARLLRGGQPGDRVRLPDISSLNKLTR